MPTLAAAGETFQPLVEYCASLGQDAEFQTWADRVDFIPVILSQAAANFSVFWENNPYFEEALDRLKRASQLKRGWDTYDGDPPNQTATALALKVLTLLRAAALPPTRLLPSAEGGIAMSFVKDSRRAEIEIYNTGEIAAVAHSGQDRPTAWDLEGRDESILAAIEQIRVHLSA